MTAPPSRPRVLLTEGTSLSARHTLYALGGRYTIDVCDPNPWLCLARYSRFVGRCIRSPVFSRDPAGYIHFLERVLDDGRYDALFAVHDETYLLARFRSRLGRRIAHALPDFAAIERLQSKTAFADLLDEIKLPHPVTVTARSRKEFEQVGLVPCYVKLPYSTAGQGVWKVNDIDALRALGQRLEAEGAFHDGGQVLIQQVAPGTLCVAQAVFRQGELLAAHTYRARAQGVGGSAWAKESAFHPRVREHLSRLGEHLHWHGPLMLDYLHDADSGEVQYIECNPRIGETGNALRSGVNLCDTLIQVAMGQPVDPVPPGRAGVRTHSVLMGLLGSAQAGCTRANLWDQMSLAMRRKEVFADSADELTRPWTDPLSLIPSAYVGARLLLNPRSVQRMVGSAVTSYALTREAAAFIRGLPDDG